MAAQQAAANGDDPMLEFAKNQKRVLEINPHSPLIQGLLEEVAEAAGDDAKEAELRDTVETLLDVTFVRSGFPVEDLSRCGPPIFSVSLAAGLPADDSRAPPRSFFGRVEGLLRRSVGVPTKAKTYIPPVKPAPAVEQGPVSPPVPADGADEDEVEQLLRSMRGFGAEDGGEQTPFDFDSFEEFDREELRRRMADGFEHHDEL